MERQESEAPALTSEVRPFEPGFAVGTIDCLTAGSVYVFVGKGEERRRVRCRMLEASRLPVVLGRGDSVLLARVEDDETVGHVILGRVGDAKQSEDPKPATAGSVPETLIIEAGEELTFRVGDGSITIRKDGKILIKGKDLVSHAQRVNRIKGGSVAIN